jgi:hypothetical protein
MRPDGSRPIGLRTVGAKRPTSQPFESRGDEERSRASGKLGSAALLVCLVYYLWVCAEVL